MKKLLLLPALLLFGCGQTPQDADSTSQTAATADADDEIVLLEETHLVDNPPVYPSEPLADGLEWVTNLDDPVFSSPDAKRGGTFTTYMLSFPLTLRMVGPDSNGGFASILRPNNLVSLVDIHPNTLKFIPLLATEWAFHPDGRTVSYHINPDITWSDGTPLTADDFLFTWDFARSEYTLAPFYQDYFGDVVTKIVKNDDHTITITGATPKSRDEILWEYSVWPTPRHFHRLDENWITDYNWRVEPNLGPYEISRVEKGRFIEFKRKDDWWGDNQKYLAHRFNPDTVRYTVIRDTNVAWEYFLRGEIDAFPVVLPNYWHEKAVGEPFDKGYIDRIKFYTDKRQPSMGMWLNEDDPILGDKNVRYGLAYAMNVDAMLNNLLRGDYERLRMHYDGYGDYSDPTIQPKPFDLTKAGEYLDAAGWTEFGPDGIRRKNGQRLSLSVNYVTQEHTPRLVLLREEAKKAGIELNLQLMDSAASFKQILEKKFQIAWMAWNTPLIPEFWQHYHSDNAHKPQTNNITNTDDPELDAMIDEYRAATDRDDRVELAHRIERKLDDIGMFIPMYKVPYTREAYWRWLRLPETHSTRTTDVIFEPMTESAFWVDERVKEETLAARREGRAFPPVYIEDRTWRVE